MFHIVNRFLGLQTHQRKVAMSSRRHPSKALAPRTSHLLLGAEREREALAESSGRDADDTNQLILTAESRSWRKEQARVAKLAEQRERQGPALSKSARRKLEAIEAKKRKASSRAEVLATLQKHALTGEQLAMMRKTATLGQTMTKQFLFFLKSPFPP